MLMSRDNYRMFVMGGITMKSIKMHVLLAVVLISAVYAGCSDESNPLAAFEPEIITTADAFQFQITDATMVNTIVSYQWMNASTKATIDHSTVSTRGSATVEIMDATGTTVYSNTLVPSGNDQSNTGAAGNWTVKVTFVNYSGTANFRVEKL